MWEVFKMLVLAIIPSMDADPEHQFRWRAVVASWLVVGTILASIHVALLCGYFPFVFKGYATADALTTTNNILRAMRLKDTERDIRELNAAACNADVLKQYEARDFAQKELANALYDWEQQNNGQAYPYLPSCDKVVTVVAPVVPH